MMSAVIPLPASIAAFYGDSQPVIASTGTAEIQRLHAETAVLFDQAVSNIKTIRREMLCSVGVSWGKDSVCTLLAYLQAHRELMAEGVLNEHSPLIVTTIDTGVESIMSQMLSRFSARQLDRFCEAEGIKLDYRVARPPLAKQYASLYFSGGKIISTPRTNADCSSLMKVDSAAECYKRVVSDYNTTAICTLLGSRVSESTTRKASIESRGQRDQTADELLQMESGRRVFLPIVEWDSNHVWYLLNHAGTDPVMRCWDDSTFPSFAPNHRLLRLTYGEAEGNDKGACPESDIQLKGAGSPGGCGGSSRSGCYFCTRVRADRSGSEMNKKKRYGVLGFNAERVRNWIYSVSQDSKFRTWHTRAIDPLTGAIALTPNVLEAPVYDQGIKLLSQLAFDDQMRARRFKERVAAGTPELDPGYADILSDQTLDDVDRQLLLQVYQEVAQEELVQPISLEIAIFLSMCHARDGIRLPPYHALVVFKDVFEAEQLAEKRSRAEDVTFWEALELVNAQLEADGVRTPYPDVNLEDVTVSELPDARMLFPDTGLIVRLEHLDAIAAELDAQIDCTIERHTETLQLPLKKAWPMLGQEERESLAGQDEDQPVAVSYMREEVIGTTMRKKPLSRRRRHPFSRRAITRRSQRGGQLKVLERGRTSIGMPSFSPRPEQPGLEQAISKPINILVPGPTETVRWYGNELDEINYAGGSYDIDAEGLSGWLEFGGLDEAIQAHGDYIEHRRQLGHADIYGFVGTQPFFSLMRWGVLSLTDQARRNAARILSRTDYFRSLGLFDFDYQELLQRAIPMCDYRAFKAKVLLDVRQERNSRRAVSRDRWQRYWNDPLVGEQANMVDLTDQLVDRVRQAEFKRSVSDLLSQRLSGFDTVKYGPEKNANQGFLEVVLGHYSGPEQYLEFVGSDARNELLGNVSHKLDLARDLVSQRKRLLEAQRRGLEEAIAFIRDTAVMTESWCVMYLVLLPSKGRAFDYPNAFSIEEVESHAQRLERRLKVVDREVSESDGVDFTRVLSLKDESVTGLLASNLF